MTSLVRFCSAMICAAVLFMPLPAAEADGVKVGVLKCKIEGGWGYIIGSSKAIDCVFRPTSYRWRDHYVGSIQKLGADVGLTKGTHLVWAVFAPGRVRRGSLAGFYFGATGEATVGVGIGGNVLIGGFRESINLQPLSLQTQTGLNAAGGIAALRLESH